MVGSAVKTREEAEMGENRRRPLADLSDLIFTVTGGCAGVKGSESDAVG